MTPAILTPIILIPVLILAGFGVHFVVKHGLYAEAAIVGAACIAIVCLLLGFSRADNYGLDLVIVLLLAVSGLLLLSAGVAWSRVRRKAAVA